MDYGNTMDFYAYQRVLGKIEDDAGLRNQFIEEFDKRSKEEMVQFCLHYAQHLIELTGFETIPEMLAGFQAMEAWLRGEVNYHAARNLSFELSRNTKEEKDIIKARSYKTMAQLLASPHVKYHGLWASDFAITLINRMMPGNMELVCNERCEQIKILQSI